MNAASNESAVRRPAPRELAKILGDCRDLAIHRLLLSFSAMLDRIGDMLMERANRSDIREESQLYLAARSALAKERGTIMGDFERRLREQVDARIAGEVGTKADFSKVDATKLTLIDTAAMDESVITGNITRVVEGFCHDELIILNRSMSHLLGRPDLETDGNPLSPNAVIEAFAAALRGVDVEDRVKFVILKELNQGSLGDLNAIYADVNRHLLNLRVVPPAPRPTTINLDYTANRAKRGAAARAARASGSSTASAEVDVMALFKKIFAGQAMPMQPAFPGAGYGGAGGSPFAGGAAGAPYAGGPDHAGGHAGSPYAGGPAGSPWAGGPPGSPYAAGQAGAPYGGGAPGAPHAGEAPGHAYAGGPAGAPYVGGPPGAGSPEGGVAGARGGGDPHWMLGVEAPVFTGANAPGANAAGQAGVPGLTPVPDPLGMPVPQGDPFARLDPAAGPRYVPHGPLAPTASGYIPGPPIMATRELGESLARLQAGETGFDLGGGAYVRFTGIPQGKHNVLRHLQQSPLGLRVNQLESMTIELVAMLFDFIFETRDLPDGIKALLARLQIPVLKAAMLDGAFFAKKSHPSRLLVNALAQAGLGWSPVMGHEDPLYRKLHVIVHRILDDFTDNLTIFEELREDLERFLAEEEKVAESNIQTTAEEINQRDRREVAPIVAGSEIERRIDTQNVPKFLAEFLRQNWQRTLEHVYLESGEDSEAWGQAMATLEDLVWSVQPKRTGDERKSLVAMLPSLLKRLSAGLHAATWPAVKREQFLSNLVEAHAAAVKPTLSPGLSPITRVAEAAKAEAELAKAAGDDAAAAKAEELAAAMAVAEPVPVAQPDDGAIDDQFLEIAHSMERGMWVEFEDDDGQLAFAKLAWVSPLRGTYLFTNRQGQKALSISAEDLATRFRNDRARLVEAEPMVDRAFTSVMAGFNERMSTSPQGLPRPALQA